MKKQFAFFALLFLSAYMALESCKEAEKCLCSAALLTCKSISGTVAGTVAVAVTTTATAITYVPAAVFAAVCSPLAVCAPITKKAGCEGCYQRCMVKTKLFNQDQKNAITSQKTTSIITTDTVVMTDIAEDIANK